MKIKSLLIFVFTLMSLTAFAQSGGIKGNYVREMSEKDEKTLHFP